LTIEQARKINYNWIGQILLGETKCNRQQVMEVDLDILVPYIDWTPFLELAIVWKYPEF
jgi:5-methyltetrahydrofolate--homocysteine methyltransferase